jgi:hypothetical protein
MLCRPCTSGGTGVQRSQDGFRPCFDARGMTIGMHVALSVQNPIFIFAAAELPPESRGATRLAVARNTIRGSNGPLGPLPPRPMVTKLHVPSPSSPGRYGGVSLQVLACPLCKNQSIADGVGRPPITMQAYHPAQLQAISPAPVSRF